MFTTAVYGETLVKELIYKGIPLEVVQCPATIWCGTLGYAPNCTEEPDIRSLLQKFQSLCHIPKAELANPDWSNSISINYWQDGAAPRGLMFSQQVLTDKQDSAHDVYTLPESLYIRVAGSQEVARAAFGKDKCGLWELFGVIKEALSELGYTIGTNGAQEIEMYDHAKGLSYAYVQVQEK